jgi:hypothetical protein
MQSFLQFLRSRVGQNQKLRVIGILPLKISTAYRKNSPARNLSATFCGYSFVLRRIFSMKIKRPSRAFLVILFLAAALVPAVFAQNSQNKISRVLLVSIDGMHAVDYLNC